MSVRRRAIQERKIRDGMRRAEYERTMRWLENIRTLVANKLLFDDQRVSAEELAACFDELTPDVKRCDHSADDGHCPVCGPDGEPHPKAPARQYYADRCAHGTIPQPTPTDSASVSQETKNA